MIAFETIRQYIDTLPEEAQTLLIDFIQLLKKHYPQPELKQESSEKSTYEQLEEAGLIGYCAIEENLSTTYKDVLAQTLAKKYDNR
ncbi:hypothetical protein [Spirulina sp. 06S082]|uniref:hypothetical protein n=1 Tax=Spirulina sp. 06S082 TaxID=3110248 RepID=UPI002B208642|nr:hypothetical protein [Spirulina sp. 06S082]MEA5468094.1 hypothetical protein [Spirulina sp. 06S082]